jgi:DNA-binding response OmpR family regulator
LRLVRELLVADADPGAAELDASGRAHRYLDVLTTGLGLRGAAILVRDVASGSLSAAASTLPADVTERLTDPTSRGGALARRAVEERRALLARRSADDPLVRMLSEADPAIAAVAILPLADRSPVGVLVLAGDETTLATDVVRTLHPALRLLALLVSPHRDGVPNDGAAEQKTEMLQAERDAQALTIRQLEAQVADLAKALADARSEAALASVAANAGKAEAAVTKAPPIAATVAPSGDPSLIVVVDTAIDWSRHVPRDHRVVVVAPSPESVERIREEAPGRIVVNVAAPGALGHIVALRAHGVTTPIVGVVAHPGSERIVGLRIVEAVPHPLAADALVAGVERAAPRGARVFAAGRDVEALMKMRQLLAKEGLSVSLARDTKQIDELLAMVRPQVVVIDLALPMRQGYELVLRMAATTPIPSMVLISPEGDPAPMLIEKLRDRLAAGVGIGAKEWLGEMAQEKLSAKTIARARASAALVSRSQD